MFGLIVYFLGAQEGQNQTLAETLQQLWATQNQLETQNERLAQAKEEAEQANQRRWRRTGIVSMYGTRARVSPKINRSRYSSRFNRRTKACGRGGPV